MVMKPRLHKKPNEYALRDLMMRYENGVPLSCDQYHFIHSHEKALSDFTYTGLKKWALKDYYRHQNEQSYLLHQETLDAAAVNALKRRLAILLQDSTASLTFSMRPEQFLQLRAMTTDELILYHGNQFITGAPFYSGGLPHVLYFQWGNLFGVAKYVVLAEEKALRSNVLIYFENRHERYLEQCILDYRNKMHEPTHPHPISQPHPPHQYHSPFATPTLTLNHRRHETESENH